MKRSNIIFDLGGVLVDWNPRHYYVDFFRGDHERVEQFLTEICTYEWNLRHDAGVTFTENAKPLIDRYPGERQAIEAYFNDFEKMFGPPMTESLEVLEELRQKKTPLYALTNWSAETFPRAKEMFPFLSLFKGIVVSGEIGLLKPDPRIYQHLLSAHDLHAEESIFIDDREENVLAAKKLGFDGIHFQSAKELRADLVSRKILKR